MITIIMAEDHQMLIDGVKSFFEYDDEINIIGSVNDGEELVKLVSLKQPKLVITDIRMPKMDGITAAKQIIKEFPTTKILAFSMFDQLDAIEQMLESGAKGYILKNSSLNEVLLAIRTIHKGEKYFDKNIDTNALGKEKNNSKKGLLTKRQIEILHLVAQGKTSREIAEQLFIGIHTVDTHRKNMIRILGLKGKGELMRYALEKKYTFKNTQN